MSSKSLRSGKKVAAVKSDSDDDLSDASSRRFTAPEVLALAMEGLPSPPKERRRTRATTSEATGNSRAGSEQKLDGSNDPRGDPEENSGGRLRSGRARVAKKLNLRDVSSSEESEAEVSTRTKPSGKKATRSQKNGKFIADDTAKNQPDKGRGLTKSLETDGRPEDSLDDEVQPSTSQSVNVHKSGTSRHKGLSEAELKKDKKKRLEYLLKQSELFAHFMTSGGSDLPGSKKDGKRGSDAEPSTDHRHTRKDDEAEKQEMFDSETKAIRRFEKNPFFIKGGEMRDYQIRGLNWLISLCENSINGILADEMGLGKTIQTIALIGYMNHVRKNEHPHLIIVPKSTLSNWNNEFKRWCPTIRVGLLKSDQDERAEFIKASQKERTWDVLITSYEIVLREQVFLRRHLWSYLVVDEAHRIKNEAAMLSTAVRTFKSYRRLLLTGTPLQNNLHELWALLNFILPDVFESSDDFDSWFDEQSCTADLTLVERLHSILRPFLLRRVKADVEKDLPPKTEIKLFVGLTPMQRTWYRQVLLKDITALNSTRGVGGGSLQNILMHLRKVCNHPYLFEGAEPGPPYTTDSHLYENCGKMILLHKLLPRLQTEGHRVLIFCQMTRLLDILEDYCIWQKYQYCRLDGQTAHEDREDAITKFHAPKSKKFVFLLSTRAGGLGINLTAADTVILYDSDWNPQMDLQAMDRAHRIGQTKPVTIFRLVTENTVEERIIERAERKMHLDALVIQSGRLVDASTKLSKDEILKMIRYNAQNIIHSDVDKITDEDIDTILAKGKAKTEEMSKKYTEQTEEGLRGLTNDFTEKPENDMYQFEGEDYRNKKAAAAASDDLDTWITLPKRERKQLYDLGGGASTSRESPPWAMPLKNKQIVKRPTVPRPATYRYLDIHFPSSRLLKLLDQEQLAYKKAIGVKIDVDPELEPDVLERIMAEQAKIDHAQPLTPEEEMEKRTLIGQSFPSWRRTDVLHMLREFEIYGPTQPDKIVVPGKSSDEVKKYMKVFLANYETLPDAARIKTRLMKGIQHQEKQQRRREVIKRKMEASVFPEQDLKIPYPNGQRHSSTGLSNAANGRVTWFEEEDRFLLCAYGAACERFADDCEELYEFIRDAIRSSPRFRFDYVMRAISTERVKDRLDLLLSWLIREAYPQQTTSKLSMTALLSPQNKPDYQQAMAAAEACMPKPLTSPSKFGDILNRKGQTGATPGSSSMSSSPGHGTASPFPKTFTLKSPDTKVMQQTVGDSVASTSGIGSIGKFGKVAPGTSITIKRPSVSPPQKAMSIDRKAGETSKIPAWAKGGGLTGSAKGATPAAVKRTAEVIIPSDSDDDLEIVYAKKPNNGTALK